MPKLFADETEKRIYAFRKWFKGKRSEENVNQEQLARRLGVSQASISGKVQTKGDNQTAITYKDLLVFFDSVNATDEEILKYMRLKEKGKRNEESYY